MAWADHFGKPVYRVRFSRTDQRAHDSVCIAARSRDEAEAGVRRMYKTRLGEIKRTARMRDHHH